MKKNHLFTGWKQVFSFTAEQNMKSGGYKISTVIIGLVIALIFAAISIVMALVQEDDESAPDFEDAQITYTEDISNVYMVNSDVLENEKLKELFQLAFSLEGAADEKIDVILIDKSEKTSHMSEEKSIIITPSETEDKLIEFEVISKNEEISDAYMNDVMSFIDLYSYRIAGVYPKDLIHFQTPYWSKTVSANEEIKTMGVMLAEMLVPMLFSFLIYAMILTHGQSVTKSVVAEKSSKLMEMILTSVKPYALIAGKVLAVASMAIIQLVVWIIFGIAGYMIGDAIANQINPEYINYINYIIETMANEGAASAFSISAIVIAVLFTIVGFLMYCVVAGLVAASVSKLEDISTAMGLFQVPVVIGWLVAYFSSFFESDFAIKIVDMIPVTSPFILPANVLIGKCSIMEAIISFAILVVTTVVLILITGKVYKGKIFNRR